MNIRASMLPSYPDCSRRGAAKQFRRELERMGYEFRHLPPSVGAAVGTATHAGAEQFLRAKHAGRTVTLDDALEPAFTGFDAETAPGAIWDETTPNSSTAKFQIQRQVAAYIHGPGASIMPLTVNGEPAVELELQATLRPGWKLTGHIDVVDDAANIRDTKTGALVRPYYAQTGGYSLLVRSNNVLRAVSGLCIDFIKRVGKTRPQPACQTINYPVVACERNAMGIINRIMTDMDQFGETQNPEVFMANPMSMMCTDKYCPAWGTAFCELTMHNH